MPTSIPFWDHPIDKLEEGLSIRKQISALQNKVRSLFGEHPPSLAAIPTRGGKRGKRTMSPEARERIAAAQRDRWAKMKNTSAGPATAVALKSSATPKKKGGLSPEGRASLSAKMKARWAARRKGAPALNASSKSAV